MDCPQCKGYRLEPCELEPGLVASRCSKCNGTLLPLMNYRYWIDNNPEITTDVPAGEVAEDNRQARICPKCSRMMTKFRVGVEPDNRIELCTGCDEAWLDAGEWQLLKALDVHDKLPGIFTEAWQRNIRLKKQEQNLKAHYAEVLGDDVFSKTDSFKDWLNQQPNKLQIIQYLTIKVE